MRAPTGYSFDHLARLSDHRGIFEHAKGIERRIENGYCTDDNARLLIVASREPDAGLAGDLGRLALKFVLDAQLADGRSRNRMDSSGCWIDSAETKDWWGRSVWGLGVAAAHHGDAEVRNAAFEGFERGAYQRSVYPRAMAFAALGAAEVLASEPGHRAARALLIDALARIGPSLSDTWVWPEARLTYANAALAEAVVAAGAGLNRSADVDRGLGMLTWLLRLETRRGHLSVTPAGGRGPDDHGPMFDQQGIEVAGMADACWRAFAVTGDPAWTLGIDAAAGWFGGDNDTGLAMFDEASGGGYDGLHERAVNLNQGAESTLAFVSTMQRVRSFASAT